jgi:hypothetical protein
MEVVIAVANFGICAAVLLGISIAWTYIFAWLGNRQSKRFVENAAVELGVSVHQPTTSQAHEKRFYNLAAQRFSPELLRNRLSDFFSLLQVCWGILGFVVQFAYFVSVAWHTFPSHLDNASYVWWTVGLFFVISNALFGMSCKLLLGRYPGEAKSWRRALSKNLENRCVIPALSSDD